MSSLKKIKTFIQMKVFYQIDRYFFSFTILLFRFLLSFFFFDWLSIFILSLLIIKIIVMKFFQKNSAFISVLSISMHIGAIYLNPCIEYQFFYGIEFSIIIYLNFKNIENEILKSGILVISLFIFLKKYNNFEINYGELVFLIYCIILFEISIKERLNKCTSPKKNIVRKGHQKQFTSKLKNLIRKDHENENLPVKILQNYNNRNEKEILNVFGLGMLIIDQNYNIVFSNGILEEIAPEKTDEEAKNILLSLREKIDINKSEFLKIPEFDIQIFKHSKHISGTLDHIKISDVSRQDCKIKIFSEEVLENPHFKTEFEFDRFTSKTSQEDLDLLIKNWKKRNLNDNLKEDTSFSESHENQSAPQSVKNYLERLFDYFEKQATASYSNRQKENKKYSMYAECKVSDQKSFFILINFIPLENKLNLNCEILITIRKLSELEKKYYEEEKTKHKILGSFCHELRTPINGLINMLDLIQSFNKDSKTSNDDYIENLDDLITNAVISSHLLQAEIDDFIDYFSYRNRILEIHPENFELQTSFEEIYNIFSIIAAKKKLNLIYEIDPNIPSIIYNDHRKLKQIIFNLLNNAIRFTNSGFIKLSAKLKKNNRIQVSVLDTGFGIKTQDLNRLGKILHNDPQNQKSTCGFGLFMCKILSLLIEGKDSNTKKKGTVVYSEFGIGTCFSFYLNCNINSEDTEKFKKNISELNFHSSNSVICPEINEKCDEDCLNSKNLDENRNNDSLEIKMLMTKSLHSLANMSSSLVKEKKKEFESTNSKESNFLRGESILSFPNGSVDFFSEKIECNCFRILIVDDVPFNIDVCSKLLKKMNLSSDSACNGLEAVEKIDKLCLPSQKSNDKVFCEKCEFYKMILMDIDMPIKNGIEATSEIINLLKNTKFSVSIVGLSAFDQEDIKRKSLEAGMKDYITKPVTFKKMKDLVVKYVSNRIKN